MELIKIHYTPSKEVKNFKEIETEVAALKKYIIEADENRQCFAIHHSQVSEHPYNFFVVHPRYCLGDNRLFDYNVIINPKIIENVPILRPSFESMEDLKWTPQQMEQAHKNWSAMPARYVSQPELEGCMSFPFRKSKKVERFVSVKVSYLNEKFKLITTTLDGLAGQIFQHECDHGFGRNIYFNGFNNN